jgi:hypothetical protein
MRFTSTPRQLRPPRERLHRLARARPRCGGPFRCAVTSLHARGSGHASHRGRRRLLLRCSHRGAGTTLYRLSFALEVLDLANPARPRLVTSVPHEARFSADVAIVGGVLFAAGGPLERFDLTSPLSPVSLGVLDVGGETGALAADGARLVLAIRHGPRAGGHHGVRDDAAAERSKRLTE